MANGGGVCKCGGKLYAVEVRGQSVWRCGQCGMTGPRRGRMVVRMLRMVADLERSGLDVRDADQPGPRGCVRVAGFGAGDHNWVVYAEAKELPEVAALVKRHLHKLGFRG